MTLGQILPPALLLSIYQWQMQVLAFGYITDLLIISLHFATLRLQVGQLHFPDLMSMPTAT